MGKSPGKWFKTVILRKKSPKSDLAKGKDDSKSVNKGHVLVSSKAPLSEVSIVQPLISQAVPQAGVRSGEETDSGVTAKVMLEGLPLLCVTEDENLKEVESLDSKEDLENVRLEKAAIKAQAALRGYQARRAFRTVKDIVRLQAFVRGQLVRRQAISTLHCMRAIVKLQALARGQKVRRSATGIEIQSKCNFVKIQGTKDSDSSGVCTEKLNNNPFVGKLLASSSVATPLHLQYSPGDPNSGWVWLERWTRSQLMEFHSQPQSNQHKFSAAEQRKGRTKQIIRKQPTANVENGSTSSSLESDKQKRKPRKLSSHPVDTVQESKPSDGKRIRPISRKTSDCKEGGERFEVDNRKLKHSLRRLSDGAVIGGSEKGGKVPVIEIKDLAAVVSRGSDADDGHVLPGAHDQVGVLRKQTDFELQPTNNPGEHDSHGTKKLLNPIGDNVNNENQSTSYRRTSFPPSFEHDENGVHTAQRVPSYMVPTESAKAKLRGQGSPRLCEDEIEKNSMNRRLSLPSSTNGKFTSMSPRAQNLVRSAGKGVIRSEKSLSTSRDGSVSDKVIKPEWKR